jgi:hypothetical protein
MSYPPPTLIPRRSRASWARRAVFVVTLGLLLGTCTVTRFMQGTEPKKDEAAANISAPFDAPAASDAPDNVIPDSAPAIASQGGNDVAPQPAAAVPIEPSPDARQPNRWYYVDQIGDGPGAIYSRSGGGWDYAFACTAPTRTIEFIAVNVGDPGTFDKQYMKVGRVKLMMDASYSKEGRGTISTKLPARHPFFDAFTGPDKALELELLEGRKLMIAIGSDVTRVIRECRAGGAKSEDDVGAAHP